MAAKKATQVDTQLDNLNGAVHELDAQLDRLLQEVSPILRSDCPPPLATESDPEPELVPIASKIRSVVDHLDVLIKRTVNALNRVEV
jgi:hypothetical protein